MFICLSSYVNFPPSSTAHDTWSARVGAEETNASSSPFQMSNLTCCRHSITRPCRTDSGPPLQTQLSGWEVVVLSFVLFFGFNLTLFTRPHTHTHTHLVTCCSQYSPLAADLLCIRLQAAFQVYYWTPCRGCNQNLCWAWQDRSRAFCCWMNVSVDRVW